MTANIDVQQVGDEDGYIFDVTVSEEGSRTSHTVTLSREDFGRLGSGSSSPADFVTRCFEFLLAREPKESILSKFDIPVIGRYFQEFEEEITRSR